MTSLSEKLYYYVNDGLPLNVLALLEEFSDDVRTKLLHQVSKFLALSNLYLFTQLYLIMPKYGYFICLQFT